jgi:hypothetical protein
MAIYYIDPHTTVNGTGTWASPYSLSITTRTTIASGDEIRIKGVALSSLLTATTYTASLTASHQLTISAGGGLGADWALYDIAYLPQYDTFFKVTAISGNIIGFSSSNTAIPFYNTTSGVSVQIRKVDKVTYPSGLANNGSVSILHNNGSIVRIGIWATDCWVDVGGTPTRVTDGTVKTLIYSSSTNSTINYYLDSDSSQPSILGRSFNVDLPNTCFLGTNSINAGPTIWIYSSESTITIGQISGASSAQSGGVFIGAQLVPIADSVITIKHMSNSNMLSSSCYAENVTINFEKVAVGYSHFASGCSGSFQFTKSLTINVGDVVCYGQTNALHSGPYILDNITINYNGYFDQFISTNTNSLYAAVGRHTINFGPSYSFKTNRRTFTYSTIAYKFYSTLQYNQHNIYVPAYPLPSGWSVTSAEYLAQFGLNLPNPSTIYPNNGLISFNNSSFPTATNRPQAAPRKTNVLVVFRDGSDPYEMLGLTEYINSNYLTYSQAVIVTTDATTYRTAGPSLKCTLATRLDSFWILGSRKNNSTKTIKIPVTGGVSCTVTGYIRTNISTYALGDVIVRMIFNEQQVGYTSPPSLPSPINNWSGQFSMTFTPSFTGEAIFCMDMFFSKAGAYWLDDFNVS